ncbi:LysR family transcriptional regulator [Burkholderia puraquae]|uniref:LysR family transcriptional regulator n=1 Tax=Burkholderia puraquae TaxID=1904757 RepID=UPI002447FFD5|nr:LysR family transcriptional regulator [Burkholderia puraquae]
MDQLQSIRAFVTVAREGGFRRAATRLRVSTAMASRLVDALETRLGARLLQRSTCHQSLTEIGELYLARVERILGAIDEIDGRFVAMGSKPEGALRIAAPVAFGLSQLSALLDRFVSGFPDVRPTVTLTDAHVDLTSEDIDVAFLTDGMPVTGAHAGRLRIRARRGAGLCRRARRRGCVGRLAGHHGRAARSAGGRR